MYETSLSKNRLIAELTRSPHGKLAEYKPTVFEATQRYPEFLAHLIAWNHEKGQVRDSKLALPLCSLCASNYPPEFVENSLAYLAKLSPRELERGFRFGLELRIPSRQQTLKRFVRAYLAELESAGHWQRVALQHRAKLKSLYALSHTKPSPRAQNYLFNSLYEPGSLFAVVAQLKNMSPGEAAGVILERKIPFLIAQGALGPKAKEPELVLALLKNMSPTEVVTNTKMLERLGVKSNPALRGAYEEALQRASSSKANVLKTTRAVEAVADESLKEKLRATQEKQMASLGVEGNWLVLADKSGSMQKAIVASRTIAATLAKLVKGRVWLTFFDVQPQTIDVTGYTLDMITAATKYILANGGTSIGCGLQRMLDGNEEVDGIAIVSDAAENKGPFFWSVYASYSKRIDKEVPVYLYRLEGNDWPHISENFIAQGQNHLQVFDLRGSTIDYYSLPNLVTTMRSNRYSLADEIMQSKLLKLSDVFKLENAITILGKEVKANA